MSTQTLVAIILALLAGGGVFATIVGRAFPQRDSALTRRAANQKDIADLQNDMRILTDYVHDLREHIATGKPPPPPDWPEGLRV